MKELSGAVGQRIVAISSGRRRTLAGPQLGGVTTTTWIYAPLLLELEDGRCLSLEPGRSSLLPAVPAESHSESLGVDGSLRVDGRSIVDILAEADGEPSVLAVLSGGIMVSHLYAPGGSKYSVEQIATDDLSLWESLVTGRLEVLRALVAPAGAGDERP